MTFWYWREWREDGKEYAARIACEESLDARRRHNLALGWSWNTGGMTNLSVSDLYWTDKARIVHVASGEWQHYPESVAERWSRRAD